MTARWFWGLVFAAVAAFTVFGRQPGGSANQAAAGEPAVIAATFSSTWCTACRVLKPTLRRVMADMAGAPVEFIEIDFTLRGDDAGAEIAEAHGFSDAYDRMKGATGFTLLIDPETGAVIDTLVAGQTRAAMKTAIENAIVVARAARPVVTGIDSVPPADQRPAIDPAVPAPAL